MTVTTEMSLPSLIVAEVGVRILNPSGYSPPPLRVPNTRRYSSGVLKVILKFTPMSSNENVSISKKSSMSMDGRYCQFVMSLRPFS